MKRSAILVLAAVAAFILGSVVPAAADTTWPEPTVTPGEATWTCPSAGEVGKVFGSAVEKIGAELDCGYKTEQDTEIEFLVNTTHGSVTEFRELIDWLLAQSPHEFTITEVPAFGKGAFHISAESMNFLSWQFTDTIVAHVMSWGRTAELAELWEQHIIIDVYTTPGEHTVNGRDWRTTCQAYSQTERCRTEIWATTTVVEGGRYVTRSGWTFNNLTYLPNMTRQEWAGNPLARNGSWTAEDGRRWRTECDTAATGRNGCRAYAEVDYVQSTRTSSGMTHKVVRGFVFNNIVQFKI